MSTPPVPSHDAENTPQPTEALEDSQLADVAGGTVWVYETLFSSVIDEKLEARGGTLAPPPMTAI